MQTQAVLDQTKVDQFVGKVLGDTSATLVTLLAALGDRLGLFKELAASGPVTSADVASRTGLNERYAREWLGGMATAGYIDYDSATQRFTLPPEHAPALAQEGGPFFFGGVHEMLPALIGVLDQVTESFRQGGGVPQSAYDAHFWDGNGAVLHGLVREPAHAAVDSCHARCAGEARKRRVGGGRRLRAWARPHQDGAGVSQLALRRVRRV
jgi:winged helix-turn-helix protein